MDPKGSLLAVRLAERHMHFLQQRARRLRISLSEALRQCVDESLRAQQLGRQRPRSPTPEERATFDQVFAALGARRRPKRNS